MRWFKRQKTLVKLMISFGLMACLTVAVGMQAFWAVSVLGHITDDLCRRHAFPLSHLRAANTELLQEARMTRNIILDTVYQRPRAVVKWFQAREQFHARFVQELAGYKKGAIRQEESLLIREMEGRVKELSSKEDEIIALARAGKPRLANEKLAEARRLSDRVDQLIDTLSAKGFADMTRASDRANAMYRRLAGLAVGGAAASLVLALALGIGISQLIARPLVGLAAELESVVPSGQTASTADWKGDEVSRVIASTRSMVERIQNLVEPDDTAEAQGQTASHKGSVEFLSNLAHEIAQRKQAEKALHAEVDERIRVEHELRESEQRYRFLVESIPQKVWTARPDGLTDSFNQRLLEYMGMSKEQALGWGWAKAVHPNEAELCLDRWKQAVREGERFDAEYRLKRASDGAYRWHLTRCEPRRGAGGEIVQWVGTCTDIEDQKQAEIALQRARAELEVRVRERTAELSKSNLALEREVEERARAEAALRESERKFREIAENLGEVIWMTDPETSQIHYINPAYERVWGRTCQSLYEQPLSFLEAIHPDDRPRVESVVSEQKTHYDFVADYRVVRPDGSVRWISDRSSQILDDAGQVIRIVGVARDVTERVQAEQMMQTAREAAEAASRAKSEFLANMSHEIRTPMNGILGMTELLLDTPLAKEQRNYLNTVKSSAEALLRVINDILDFSKIEAGKLDLERSDFRLRGILATAMNVLSQAAHRKGLELAYHVAPNVPDMLLGDALRLQQILTNLVGNAVKFTEHGEVIVTVGVQEQTLDGVVLSFEVRDTGIGIPSDKKQAIFEAFTQADSSTTRQFGGTGLGLPISSRLVQMMGGSITVESELGRGSTFAFKARFGRSQAQPGEPVASQPALDGLRTLVVDDNATNRTILSEMLHQWHMTPVEAANGAFALAELRRASHESQPFPLVLVDAMMPEMDGFTLIEEIRHDPGLAGSTILMLSSSDRAGDLARCRELGVAVYLIKPINQSDLLEAIMTALGGAAVPNADRASNGAATAMPPSRRLQILLAEDNEVNQEVTTTMLEKRGHTVTVAKNGREVLDVLDGHDFDVVLMDVQMPEMDGLAATRAIREREQGTCRHLPIVALTAHAMRGDSERCLAAGMDGYVAKPVRARELFHALARVVPSMPPAQSAAAEGELPSNAHAAPADESVPVFDPQAALARVEGDRNLLRKMMEVFAGHAAELVAEIRAATAGGHAEDLQRSAHKLKGSVATFGAARAAELALRLEVMGRSGILTDAASTAAELESEVGRLQQALALFTSGETP